MMHRQECTYSTNTYKSNYHYCNKDPSVSSMHTFYLSSSMLLRHDQWPSCCETK